VIGLGTLAAALAAFGTLNSLVEAASLTFLFTFSVVCGLAYWQSIGMRVISGFGALAGLAASIALVIRLVRTDFMSLMFLVTLTLVAVFGRPILLRHVRTEGRRT
jgi:hypothetical protein